MIKIPPPPHFYNDLVIKAFDGTKNFNSVIF